MDKGVSVVIPVLNEEQIIGRVIDDLVNIFQQTGIIKYEIIVIDDGSTDKTKDVINSKKIKVIIHNLNRGYGFALKSGIKNAIYENIVVIDGDGTYSAKDVPQLLDFIDDFDMVVGARTKKGINFLSLRSVVKGLIKRLAIFLSETDIPDLNSGLRAFKKNTVMEFFPILPSGFSFTTTITLAMINRGYRIKYVSIDYYNRKKTKSKFHPIRDTLNLFIVILEIVIYYNPLKIFVPLSIFLVVIAILLFFYSWLILGRIMDAAVTLLLVSALQILVLGLIANLINKRGQR